jgi:hypothetical protein
MSGSTSSVSLTDLSSAGVLLSRMDAVTIAHEVVMRAARGDLPGIPVPEELRLRDEGEIEVAGPAARGNEIRSAARLLAALLSHAVEDVAAPETFQRAFAGAFPSDEAEAEYDSLDQFVSALAPFAAPDPEAVIQQLVSRWRATKGIDNALDEFAAETPVNGIADDPLDEFPADAPFIAEPRSAIEFALTPEPPIALVPAVAAVSPVAPERLVTPEPPVTPEPLVTREPRLAMERRFAWEAPSAAETTPLAYATFESPVELELRPPPADAELVVDAPLFQSRDIALLPYVPLRSGRWVVAVAVAAVLAALLPALWFVSRPSSGPVGEEQGTARQAESATPRRRTESATPTNVAEAPKAGVPTSPAADPPATPGPPASKSASTATSGLTSNESAAKPATAGETGPTELITNDAFSPSFASAADPGMFYHSGTGPGSAIMRADTDKSGMVSYVTTLVNDRGSNFHARPSPDGQWLAFDSDRDGERGIYVSDANGQGVRRVSGPGFASVPSWSPDGRRIAFVRSEAARPRVWNIWIVDVATGNSTRITSHRIGQPWGAAWFPDGNRIAYSNENRLIVRTLKGKDVRIFKSPIRGRLLRTPAVSPDGKRIIFQVRRDGAWMLDLPTGAMSRVLKDPTAEEFTWSPDGRRVAYHSRRSGTWGVWVMAPRGA